jgi:hypothetical protein
MTVVENVYQNGKIWAVRLAEIQPTRPDSGYQMIVLDQFPLIGEVEDKESTCN